MVVHFGVAPGEVRLRAEKGEDGARLAKWRLCLLIGPAWTSDNTERDAKA